MAEIIVSENYQKALELNHKIKANAEIMQKSFYEVCIGLKEMRDGKLYKELGYQNFNDYAEQEVGIKRIQAYSYIQIVSNLPAEFVQSTEHLGVQKLYLLSKLDEISREKIVENTDIENTSVKNLKEKIKNLNSELSKANQEMQEIKSENEILSERLEELEKKPVEVAVSDNSHELENMRKAMADCDLKWRTDYDKLQEEVFSEKRKHNQEIERVRAEYEQKIADIEKPEAVKDMKSVFKAYLANAVDSTKRLLEFVNTQKDSEDYEFFMDKVHGLSKQLGGKND